MTYGIRTKTTSHAWRELSMTDVEEVDGKSPFDRLTKKTAVVALLCALPFFFFFAALGDPAKGRAAAGCVGISVFVVWIRWDLRRRVWFWATVAILVVLHVPLVLFIPWTNTNYPGGSSPVGSVGSCHRVWLHQTRREGDEEERRGQHSKLKSGVMSGLAGRFFGSGLAASGASVGVHQWTKDRHGALHRN